MNQSSWRQLRVYNLGWGLTGGGGFAGGDNGARQSPGLEQGAQGQEPLYQLSLPPLATGSPASGAGGAGVPLKTEAGLLAWRWEGVVSRRCAWLGCHLSPPMTGPPREFQLPPFSLDLGCEGRVTL